MNADKTVKDLEELFKLLRESGHGDKKVVYENEGVMFTVKGYETMKDGNLRLW